MELKQEKMPGLRQSDDQENIWNNILTTANQENIQGLPPQVGSSEGNNWWVFVLPPSVEWKNHPFPFCGKAGMLVSFVPEYKVPWRAVSQFGFSHQQTLRQKFEWNALFGSTCQEALVRQ